MQWTSQIKAYLLIQIGRYCRVILTSKYRFYLHDPSILMDILSWLRNDWQIDQLYCFFMEEKEEEQEQEEQSYDEA